MSFINCNKIVTIAYHDINYKYLYTSIKYSEYYSKIVIQESLYYNKIFNFLKGRNTTMILIQMIELAINK